MIGPSNPAFVKYVLGSTTVVFDGNSLVAGLYASGPSAYMPAQFAAMPPVSGIVPVSNTGVSGQTIDNMRTRGAQYVDALFAEQTGSKVLFCWEGTNSITGGETAAQAIADLQSYCAERLAATPGLKIVWLTCIPRFQTTQWSIVDGNAQLRTFNQLLVSNYRALGVTAVCDVTASGVFTADPSATFAPANMIPYSAGDGIHLNDAGYGLIAQYVAATARRISAR